MESSLYLAGGRRNRVRKSLILEVLLSVSQYLQQHKPNILMEVTEINSFNLNYSQHGGKFLHHPTAAGCETSFSTVFTPPTLLSP